MQQRPWYKRKRIWALAFLLVLFIISKMEWAKMRYDRDAFLATINNQENTTCSYSTRKVANKTIHFLEKINQENAPLLVMVHGSPGALNAYAQYLQDSLLSTKMNMIAVDRSGFGYSDFGQSEPSLSIQATLIAAILEKYPNQKKILFGHSMGGPVITRLAIDYPDLVDGLIMVAPSISPDLEPSNRWRLVMDFPLFRWFTPAALRVCNQEIIPLRKELEEMATHWQDITVPVCVIQGEKDKLVPMENAAFAKEKMTHNKNVKTNIVKDGNHFILWSEIPLIRKEILNLLGLLETVDTRTIN